MTEVPILDFDAQAEDIAAGMEALADYPEIGAMVYAAHLAMAEAITVPDNPEEGTTDDDVEMLVNQQMTAWIIRALVLALLRSRKEHERLRNRVQEGKILAANGQPLRLDLD